MILENISLLLELTRWKKQAMLSHGGRKLLGAAINSGKAIYSGARLSKDALSKLETVGIKKSHDAYMQGFNTGSDNIIKKNKEIMHPTKPPVRMMFGADAKFGDAKFQNGQIHINRFAKGQPILKRHEADEINQLGKTDKFAREYNGKLFADKNQSWQDAQRISSADAVTNFYKKDKLVGMHVNEKVLKNEKRNMDMIKSLYKQERKPNAGVTATRKKSSEYSDKLINTPTSKIHARLINSSKLKGYAPVLKTGTEDGVDGGTANVTARIRQAYKDNIIAIDDHVRSKIPNKAKLYDQDLDTVAKTPAKMRSHLRKMFSTPIQAVSNIKSDYNKIKTSLARIANLKHKSTAKNTVDI